MKFHATEHVFVTTQERSMKNRESIVVYPVTQEKEGNDDGNVPLVLFAIGFATFITWIVNYLIYAHSSDKDTRFWSQMSIFTAFLVVTLFGIYEMILITPMYVIILMTIPIIVYCKIPHSD